LALGLFLGKQAGVFGSVWLIVRLGLARRPAKATWLQVYGIAILCGVGFTMSLFIGLLAFAQTPELETGTKIGVLLESILSIFGAAAILGLGGRR
jgi:NhaA family Na+:H+ antiporter